MADNDQNNDEYKFDELDSFDNESMETIETDSTSSKLAGQEVPQKKDVKRNALIAVGLIIFVMVLYKIIGSMFFGKSGQESAKQSIPPVVQETPHQPIPAEVTPQPIQPEQPVQPVQSVVQESDSVLKQKVSDIEVNEQNIRTEISTVGEQLGNVNGNVSNLNAQITKLNHVVGDLADQMKKQSEVIAVLMERTKPKPIRRRPIRQNDTYQPPLYYINAVIPGRAWLISTNGSTLTVREGTKIEGYGIVKLIDSMQGRVLTSSGRVIRFSQEDS